MKFKLFLLGIATFSFAASIDGIYMYKEKFNPRGVVGGTEIKTVSPDKIQFLIQTSSKKAHACSAEGVAQLKGNKAFFKYGEGYIEIVFGDNYLEVSAPQFAYCGTYGWMTGRYVKEAPKTTALNQSSQKLTDSEYEHIKKTSPDYVAAEKELSRAYANLKKSLNSNQKEQLKTEQVEWIRFRDQKAYEADKKGTQKYINTLIGLTKERTNQLNSIVK